MWEGPLSPQTPARRRQPAAARLSTLPAELFRGAAEPLNEVPRLPHLEAPTPRGSRGVLSTELGTLPPADIHPI